MTKAKGLIQTLFFLCTLLAAFSVFSQQTLQLSGLARNDQTRPDLHESKSSVLQTLDAGIVGIGKRHGFYWELKPSSDRSENLYLKVTYPNPGSGDPLVNDMIVTPKHEKLVLSSPDYVTGLKKGETYTFKVEVFINRTDSTPIDTLEQNIFSMISN